MPEKEKKIYEKAKNEDRERYLKDIKELDKIRRSSRLQNRGRPARGRKEIKFSDRTIFTDNFEIERPKEEEIDESEGKNTSKEIQHIEIKEVSEIEEKAIIESKDMEMNEDL